jgi:hypothetical protein
MRRRRVHGRPPTFGRSSYLSDGIRRAIMKIVVLVKYVP